MRVKTNFNLFQCLCLISVFFVGLIILMCPSTQVMAAGLQPHEELPLAVESPQSENNGFFSSPAFNASGTSIAIYDSGNDLVRIYNTSGLTQINSIKPTRRPRRLSFSPGGNFLVIEARQGWVEAYLKGTLPSNVSTDSKEAIRDDIQRLEVFNLQTGQSIQDLSCDAVETKEPKGGWLWARNKAISPGYKSSAILEAHFSSDESEVSALCWNGIQQHWSNSSWERLDDLPSPSFWKSLTRLVNAEYWAQNSVSSRSADGQIVVLNVREKRLGFGTTYIWKRNESQAQPLPGKCGAFELPVYSLSSDGSNGNRGRT
jgi:hypothetical protein